jgi:hypothetical protein
LCDQEPFPLRPSPPQGIGWARLTNWRVCNANAGAKLFHRLSTLTCLGGPSFCETKPRSLFISMLVWIRLARLLRQFSILIGESASTCGTSLWSKAITQAPFWLRGSRTSRGRRGRGWGMIRPTSARLNSTEQSNEERGLKARRRAIETRSPPCKVASSAHHAGSHLIRSRQCKHLICGRIKAGGKPLALFSKQAPNGRLRVPRRPLGGPLFCSSVAFLRENIQSFGGSRASANCGDL